MAARLEVILEEMLEVRGLPTGRMPSMSCNESEEERPWDARPQRPWSGAGDRLGGAEGTMCPQLSCGCPRAQMGPTHLTPC